MMATTDTRTDIPLPQSAALAPGGRFSEVWWRFFLILWNRTGQAAGGDVAELEQAVARLQAKVSDLEASAEGYSAASAVAGVYEAVARLEMPADVANAAVVAALSASAVCFEARMESMVAPMASNCCGCAAEVAVPVHSVYDDETLHAVATPTTAGFMSAADKAKLDSL